VKPTPTRVGSSFGELLSAITILAHYQHIAGKGGAESLSAKWSLGQRGANSETDPRGVGFFVFGGLR
jgi:hypothetical protein